MNYTEAKKIQEEKVHIIGTKIKGETIDELIICPTNPTQLEIFKTIYNETQSAEFATSQFLNEDLDIAVVIGKKRLVQGLMISWMSLDWVEANLNK